MRPFCCLMLGVALVGGGIVQDISAQTDQTIYVVTYIEATPSAQQQVAGLLRRLAEAGRTEGAIRFEALQRTTEPNQFALLEAWKDQRALDAHRAAAAAKQFRDQAAPLLLTPPDERLCVATDIAPDHQGRATVFAVTHVDVPGNSRDSALDLLKTLAQRNRANPRNLRFDIVHQRDRTNHFSVVATWSDQKSADEYQLAEQTKDFRSRLTPLLGALYDQRWYKPL